MAKLSFPPTFLRPVHAALSVLCTEPPAMAQPVLLSPPGPMQIFNSILYRQANHALFFAAGR